MPLWQGVNPSRRRRPCIRCSSNSSTRNKQHREGSTHEFYKRQIVSCATHIGKTLIFGELKPFHVTKPPTLAASAAVSKAVAPQRRYERRSTMCVNLQVPSPQRLDRDSLLAERGYFSGRSDNLPTAACGRVASSGQQGQG